MSYYYYLDPTGGTYITKSEAPPTTNAVKLSDAHVQQAFQCIDEFRPFRVVDGNLQIASDRPSYKHRWSWETLSWDLPYVLEEKWQEIRSQRDFLLLQCDWTQLPDVPLATKEVWVGYRQALRDITLQPDPFNIVWPAMPV